MKNLNLSKEQLQNLPDEKLKELFELAIALKRKQPIFYPNPGKQTLALQSDAYEVYYGGSASGGKTSLLVGASLLNHHRAIIFRRTYKQLTEIIEQTLRYSTGRGRYHSSDHVLKLTDGRNLELAGVEHVNDWQNYAGRPHDFIGFDEVTQFPYSLFSKLIAWNRASKPNQRCRIILAGNPP